MSAVWRCRLCEGVNRGGRVCATCGAEVPHGEPLRAAIRTITPSTFQPATPPPTPPPKADTTAAHTTVRPPLMAGPPMGGPAAGPAQHQPSRTPHHPGPRRNTSRRLRRPAGLRQRLRHPAPSRRVPVQFRPPTGALLLARTPLPAVAELSREPSSPAIIRCRRLPRRTGRGGRVHHRPVDWSRTTAAVGRDRTRRCRQDLEPIR